MTPLEKELFEKIVRAKVKLESGLTGHKMTCPADDGEGNCTCGASAANAKIQAALSELK